MPRVLILFGHPALEKSRVNEKLVRAVHELDGVTFHDLYEQYPAFDVDVRREQELLVAHDVVVMQHPFYWWSVPALCKQWIDLVLEHGWAYGSTGRALVGKTFMNALTAGGPNAAYGRQSLLGKTLREMLAPIEHTARLCGMRYLPPFVVHGTHALEPPAIDAHAARYRRLVEALRDGTLDFDAHAAADYLELPEGATHDAR
jgi:glutathione-regulated potassium-efflux system ancillary protein KefG